MIYVRWNADEIFDDVPILRLSHSTCTRAFWERDHVTEAFRFPACTHIAIVMLFLLVIILAFYFSDRHIVYQTKLGLISF